MFELGGNSLSDVYKMSWREFQLRKHGFNRADKNEWLKFRDVAFYSLVGPHANPKLLPKTKEKFMPLQPKQPAKKTLNNRQELFLSIYKKYIDERH